MIERRLVLWCVLLAALMGVGCGAPARTPTAVNPLALTRVDAFHGTRLVLTLPPGGPMPEAEASLDDGTRLRASVYRVHVAFGGDGSGSRSWLPDPGVWSTSEAQEKTRRGGAWVVVIDMPLASQAATMTAAGREYALHWLPATSLLPMGSGKGAPELDPWLPAAFEEWRGDAGLAERVRSESASPLTRWRYRLLLDGLGGGPGIGADLAFADPIIEAIAKQNEDRWRVALAWLWSADPALAWRLKQRLAAVVDFGGGVIAPAWSVDHSAMDRLLADMLNPVLSPARRCELAEAWLRDQPSGIAWIMDDGGLLDDRRERLIAGVGFANVSDQATRAWADSAAQPDVEAMPLLPLNSIKLLVPVARCESGISQAATVVAHVGTVHTALATQCGRLPVRPPGLPIGPLLLDYSMEAWTGVSREGLVPNGEWVTGAMLHRPAPDPTAPPSGVESRRWELVVECKSPAEVRDPAALDRESVRLWFGPTGRPTEVLRVDMSGRVASELPPHHLMPDEMRAPAGQVEVVRGADRWSFRLALPPGAVEDDGTVRLGVVRTDANGRRSAWPRAMMPGQGEPGRAALDVGAWAGVADGT